MPYPKQVISWPLTGGIATKASPIAQIPGSHILLQNVRQERTNEWRARPGRTHNAIDDLPSQPMKEIGLPGGGRLAMTAETGNSPAAFMYQSGATASRWVRADPGGCAQSTPMVWQRRSVVSTDTAVQTDYCEGAVYSLTAWAGVSGASAGLFVRLQNKADGTILPISGSMASFFPTGRISATGVRPRCISVSNKLWLFYVDTSLAVVNSQAWDATTGALTVINNVLPGNTNAIHFMDALSYSGSSITVVFRDSAGTKARYQELNATTGAVTTNVLEAGIDCDVALTLCPDPDSSGVRFLMASASIGPVTAMVRLNSAGTVLTTESCEAVQSTQVTGCAYANGAGWMAVYNGNGIRSVKKVSGVIGSPITICGSGTYGIDSVAWRDPSFDLMHFILGMHSGSTTDPQDSYFEMVLPYNTGSSVGVNSFPEPQARLIPLQAGPGANAVYPGHLSHMQPLGGAFVGSLLRLSREGLQGITQANQYAVDRWQATYLSSFNFPTLNQGDGTITAAASYLPVGSLLASGGAAPVPHGLATIPQQPTAVPGVAGSLTAGQAYQGLVVVEVPDENGNIWVSPPSQPFIVTAAAMAAKTNITWTVTISALENPNRIVTVKLYRTKGNGFVYQLVNQRTGPISTIQHFTYVDVTSDTDLSSGDFLSGEIPATITPAFSHVRVFGNRLWGIERDFPNLWLSKPLQKGRQPEFPGVTPFVVPLSDEYGDATALYALNDKLLVNKQNAIYTVSGDGPDNAGGGFAPSVTRVDSDVGSLPGSPLVSTGAEAYFVSQRGIFSIDQSSQITWVGADVDLYLNQPSIGTPLTILGGVFSAQKNEVRFIGMTSFGGQMKALVYDRFRAIWYVDNGAGMGMSSSQFAMSRMSAAGEIRYTSGGVMSFEGNDSVTDDGGTAFTPLIESAWVSAAGLEGRLRLKRGRVIGTQPIGGVDVTPTLFVFWNFDDTGTLFPNSESASPTAPISGALTTVRGEIAPRNQKCTSFKLRLQLPNGITALRLDQWSAVVAVKPQADKLPAAQRWA